MKKAHMKKLDLLWSKKIRELGWCCVCGKTGRLNAHHYVGRMNRAVRWDLRNGFCLCVGCHTYSIRSAHQDPEWFREQALKLRGQVWLDELTVASRIDCMAAKQVYEDVLKGIQDGK